MHGSVSAKYCIYSGILLWIKYLLCTDVQNEFYLLLHKDMPNTEWHYKNKTNQSTTFFVSVEKKFWRIVPAIKWLSASQITKKHHKKYPQHYNSKSSETTQDVWVRSFVLSLKMYVVWFQETWNIRYTSIQNVRVRVHLLKTEVFPLRVWKISRTDYNVVKNKPHWICKAIKNAVLCMSLCRETCTYL